MQSADLDIRVDLSNKELREWRLAALKLAANLRAESDWLSHQNVYLEEMYAVTGHHHLWLSIDHLLHGSRYFEKFDYKLIVPADVDQTIGSEFSLEFRQLMTGDAPLFSWPADTADEFGSYLRVNVSVDGEAAEIHVDGDITDEDQRLIDVLVMNTRYVVARLNSEGVDLGRPGSDWMSILAAFSHFDDKVESEYSAEYSATPDIAEGTATGHDGGENHDAVNNSFELQEVYEVEGYSHIAFITQHPDRGALVVKYQLVAGDGMVEFRSLDGGELGLPFDHMDNVTEDEYGQLISLRYIDLHDSAVTDVLCRDASQSDVELLNIVKSKAAGLMEFVGAESREGWASKFW
jgi:hypothetical protein